MNIWRQRASNDYYTPMQYTAIFHGCKKTKQYFSFEKWRCFFLGFYITLIVGTCLYLTYVHRIYPCKLQFCFIKVGCEWVYITRARSHDESCNGVSGHLGNYLPGLNTSAVGTLANDHKGLFGNIQCIHLSSSNCFLLFDMVIKQAHARKQCENHAICS